MNVIMAGVDHKSASLELREIVSFSQSRLKEILRAIKEKYKLSGIIIVTTCNRTEIYVSYAQNQECVHPVDMLCSVANIPDKSIKNYFQIKKNKEACKYLFEVASGIHSLIFGDDQIVSQVRNALAMANEVKCADSILNTMFRHAVTCAKIVKSKIVLKNVSTSVATQCVSILTEFITSNQRPKALVVGNGEIGRLVCQELARAGCEVLVTFRKYKYHELVLPSGCIPIDYKKREEHFSQVDIVVSATASPHYTITHEMIEHLAQKPKYMLDLAVPRDIEPSIKSIPNIVYYDIDSLGKTALHDNSKEIEQVLIVVYEQLRKFQEWLAFHKCSNDILDIKKLAVSKIPNNIDRSLNEPEKIETAINKTIDLIFYSLKDHISTELLASVKSCAIAKR